MTNEASNSAPVRVRPEIASLPPYKQGKQAGADAFKLSSNENPYEPLPAVIDAIRGEITINRYPDASAARLRARLAEKYGVTSDEVHVGSGSVALIAQLLLAVAGPGDEVIYAWRSFEAYPGLTLVPGATSVQVPLTADFAHDLDAMAAAVTDNTRAIILCTPNNPTGGTITTDAVREFLAKVPGNVLVMLDEAYAEFVTSPAAVDGLRDGILTEFPNVVVLRTFSKAYGLAGLRVGYVIGNQRILDAARSTAIPLSVTAQAETAALVSLDNEAQLMQRVAVLVERRTQLIAGLRAAGLMVPDSEANFVWLAFGDDTMAAAAAFEAGGVIVRPFAGEGVRISIGEAESIDVVVHIARSVVETLPEGHPVRGLA
ncbi:histidinol-phosphate transaminase [Microbacterium sp. NC79]|uniref:histidinol-phosphate transaminase n=1 Tax=Microbacterium sp. NC79 TaxID=2851009 RepID=UPI001C2C2DE9|nr:histidinol-phosphate transaminase [Microbacterium sp. NC79]